VYSPACSVCGQEGLIKHLKYEKGKVFPVTYHEGMWGEKHSPTLFFNLGARWRCVVVSTIPGPLTPEKEPQYPLYRRLDGPWCWSGWVPEISPPLRFKPQTVKPVVSHYSVTWNVGSCIHAYMCHKCVDMCPFFNLVMKIWVLVDQVTNSIAYIAGETETWEVKVLWKRKSQSEDRTSWTEEYKVFSIKVGADETSGTAT